MARIDLEQAREWVGEQQCARGHPKVDMVEVGHSYSRDDAYLEYQCPTCDRKLKYELERSGVADRKVSHQGRMDPE